MEYSPQNNRHNVSVCNKLTIMSQAGAVRKHALNYRMHLVIGTVETLIKRRRYSLTMAQISQISELRISK
jgi:hypothetical protein